MPNSPRKTASTNAGRHTANGCTAAAGTGDFYIEPDHYASQLPEIAERHDLIRRWCGADAVDRRDELVALRTEVRRLGTLVTEAVDALRRAGADRDAKRIEHELGVPVTELKPPPAGR